MKKLNSIAIVVLIAGLLFIGISCSIILPAYIKGRNKPMDEELVKIDIKKFELPEIVKNDSLLKNFNFDVTILDSNHNTFRGFSENYQTDSNQILCFRGNQERNNPTRGQLLNTPQQIELQWKFETAVAKEWGGGSGWTGQPLMVKWSKTMKLKLGIKDSAFINNEDAIEGIVGSLSGEIYFFNTENGKSTREPLKVDGPIKGTVSLDPRMNGLLYVGQGIGQGKRFGAYIFNMISRKELLYLPGIDNHAPRGWGAFDSNPLIDAKSGTVIWPGENGLIYKIDCSDISNVHIVSKFSYKSENTTRQGIESSASVIGKYGFFADNSGNIFCLDLIKFDPKWVINTYDDTDASLVLSLENGKYFLYTGNEVDHRKPEAKSKLRKIDVLTGKQIWSWGINCSGSDLFGKSNSGGMLATPLLGENNCKDLIFTIFSRTNGTRKSEFIAINKKTGKKRFGIKMDGYSWASPVGLNDKKGNMYIFFTDVHGITYLINGKNGKMIHNDTLPYIFESSPAVMNNQIIVGVRGKNIIGLKVI
jgi:hypothetical protein